ncbi:branched-chain amino acid transporter permease [Tersicoccus sp. Bi-70]|uniref:branched-chain amino acid transporter permease n=1 Tax=Tersicoccus sp. Bi-70 TaxID=1897634 RepID=UPI000975C906|nr:AzlD domain-containing protein [Tersicoccus sp. Bi-70]OMH32376.1 branched-chain amino acid transporter AzlD [Tersicoccus sp. Bi-70]
MIAGGLNGWYVAGVLAIMFAITFTLRALPFALLKPLRASRFVQTMSVWMPVGILGILAAVTFRSSAGHDTGSLLSGLIAVVVTVVVHLTLGRRTLLSVGLGTATFVVLVNVAGMA